MYRIDNIEMIKKLFYTLLILPCLAFSQSGVISGYVKSEGEPIPYASISIDDSTKTLTDIKGKYSLHIPEGKHKITAQMIGFYPSKQTLTLSSGENRTLDFELEEQNYQLDEVVISATLKPVSKSKSPVSVEVYTPTFFKKNPTPNIFDALQNVNGVRPQLNCAVCNTGDIHINGLEGPYTMVLIDGMPIVSSLSTVYGLSGIPNSLIERIEIVKGPASTLYGSEAVGGLINVITKKPPSAPLFTADIFSTSWLETNIDIGLKTSLDSTADILTGFNYYLYNTPIDNNADNFTDVTLQNRFSLFQKWNFHRKSNKVFSVAGRYFKEDRWGGDLNWTPEFRGGDSIYGENIITDRFEFIGTYQLPTREHLVFQSSYNYHNQNSVYGNLFYLAKQHVAYGQLLWDKQIKKHDLLAGLALRYTFYDDNTTATENDGTNNPDHTTLPGVFIQDEITLSQKHTLLLGTRYDYNSNHGNIFTPRLAYKWSPNKKNTVRLNAGTGFRVVNLFTEDHAALTGSRDVIIEEELKPEESYNINLNYVKKLFPSHNRFIGLDASAWYTYFTNQIIPDYETNSNQIIYSNLDGFGQSMGVSLNIDLTISKKLKILAGGTYMDVSYTENNIKDRPLLTERWTGVWTVTYKLPKLNLSVDYTGNIYGPMDLPVLHAEDPRKPTSQTWSIQNIQFTYKVPTKKWSLYFGIKNLLNWTPNKDNPFIISRTNDPFDKNVDFDAEGNALVTSSNPYGLVFDPAYVYAPNQGIRVFLGYRLNF